MTQEKVFLKDETVKDFYGKRFQCKLCEKNGSTNYLRFFMINADTEVFKCDSVMCSFPFRNFIFRNIADQKLYTVRESVIQVASPMKAFSPVRIRSPTPPVIPQEESVLEEDINIEEFLKDFFPETPKAIEGSSQPSPSKKLSKVPLVSSLLKDIEKKQYKCKSCEAANVSNFLRFFVISENTEIFKCQSPSCMFPHRSYIFRDRRDQSYYMMKETTVRPSLSQSETAIDFTIENCSFSQTPNTSRIDDILGELFPEDDEPSQSSIDFTPVSPERESSVEMEVSTSPKTLTKTMDLLTKKKSVSTNLQANPKNIRSPLDLLKSLLSKKDPLPDSDIEDCLSESQTKMFALAPKLKSLKYNAPRKQKKNIVKQPEQKPDLYSESGPSPSDMPNLDIGHSEDLPLVERRISQSQRKFPAIILNSSPKEKRSSVQLDKRKENLNQSQESEKSPQTLAESPTVNEAKTSPVRKRKQSMSAILEDVPSTSTAPDPKVVSLVKTPPAKKVKISSKKPKEFNLKDPSKVKKKISKKPKEKEKKQNQRAKSQPIITEPLSPKLTRGWKARELLGLSPEPPITKAKSPTKDSPKKPSKGRERSKKS